MRRPHCTLRPHHVHQTAQQALNDHLPWNRFGRSVAVGKLLDLLLLCAALTSSLSAIVKRFRFGFSHETARQAVHTNLPPLDVPTKGLVDALHQFGSRHLRRREWVVAIDEHRCPFYGDRAAEGVTGGQKKHGTQYAYGYATAVLVHRRHRYTVGLIALDGKLLPHEVVAAVLEQLESRGLRIRGVVLDSGFDSGETLLLLRKRGYSYTVPLRRKGHHANRRNALWTLPVGTITTVEWRTDKTNKRVRTRALVWRRAGEKEAKVFAFGGWGERRGGSELRRAWLARRWYRKRFGIETSYRQMRQCQAKTTAKNVRYRLLLIGVALLLRQAWVWLTGLVAKSQGLKPTAWVAELPLARMVEWLADLLRDKYKECKEIPLHSPLDRLGSGRL